MNRQFLSMLFAALLLVAALTACAEKTGTISIISPADTRAHAESFRPHSGGLPAQLVDRQALAEYQTSLPLYAKSLRVPKVGVVVEQIADHQALAEYQATLTLGYVESEVTKSPAW